MSKPASRAATTVSSRATASNDAGTVTRTSCSSAGSSGLRVVPRRAQVREVARATRRPATRARRPPSRRRARAARRGTAAPARCDRSTGCTATTSPTTPAGAAARRRARARTCRPRSAAGPTTAAGAAPAATSCSLGSSRNDGRVGRSAISPGPTTCVTRHRARGRVVTATATAEFVVPRSMPRIVSCGTARLRPARSRVRSTPSASVGKLGLDHAPAVVAQRAARTAARPWPRRSAGSPRGRSPSAR